nr:hypothetical protein [Neisseria meningitidis]
MPSETVSDGIFIVINKNQDKATNQTVQIVRNRFTWCLQHLRESFSLAKARQRHTGLKLIHYIEIGFRRRKLIHYISWDGSDTPD